MRSILIMEDHPSNKGMVFFFENAGYKVFLATTQGKALEILNGENRIDFVISAASYWKECYELAIFKFGHVNVIIFTGSIESKNELEKRSIVVFEKPEVFEVLLQHVAKVCPPN